MKPSVLIGIQTALEHLPALGLRRARPSKRIEHVDPHRRKGGKVERVDAEHSPIPLIQLEADNFINVGLEVFEDGDATAEPIKAFA